MTHFITPPPELVQQWVNLMPLGSIKAFTAAARWGADQELEACCEWFTSKGYTVSLRAARRPKPLSLKQRALEELENIVKAAKDFGFGGTDPTTIRRALEELPE